MLNRTFYKRISKTSTTEIAEDVDVGPGNLADPSNFLIQQADKPRISIFSEVEDDDILKEVGKIKQ